MRYIYTTTIKDKVIQEKGVAKFVYAVNTEIGLPILTTNILYNYFSRPEKMKVSVVNSMPITREQFFYEIPVV